MRFYESLIEQEYADRPNSISKKLILLSDRERILKFAELVYAKGADNIPEPDSQDQDKVWGEVIRYCRRVNLECSAGGYLTMFRYLKKHFNISRKPYNPE